MNKKGNKFIFFPRKPRDRRISMEFGEGSRTSSSDYSSQYFDSRRTFGKVVVVVDASMELTRNALNFSIKNIVQPGDQLTVLGIMDRLDNPMGFRHIADTSKFLGTNEKVLDQKISKMMDIFAKKLQLYSDHCDSKGVFLDIKIHAGPDFKLVTLQQAIELQATWIILDRHLKKDQKFYMDRLPCNVLLMNEKDEAIYLRDCTGPRSTTERFQKCLSNIVLQDIQSTVDFYAQTSCQGFAYNPSTLEAEEVLSNALIQNVHLGCNKIIDEINGCKNPESQTASTLGNHFFPAVVSTDSAAEIQTQLVPENGVKRASGAKITSFPPVITLTLVLLFLAYLVPLLSRRGSFLD